MAYIYDVLAIGCVLLRIDDHDSLLDVTQDEVHMAIIRLDVKEGMDDTSAKALRRTNGSRTCKIPETSLSPRSFTDTRSLNDRRMRSNGS